MNKYIVFISNRGGKAVPKESVTPSLTKEMKAQGFRKHHIEVEAENEVDAINALNNFNTGFMEEVKEYTGSIMIICACFILMALLYLFI